MCVVHLDTGAWGRVLLEDAEWSGVGIAVVKRIVVPTIWAGRGTRIEEDIIMNSNVDIHKIWRTATSEKSGFKNSLSVSSLTCLFCACSVNDLSWSSILSIRFTDVVESGYWFRRHTCWDENGALLWVFVFGIISVAIQSLTFETETGIATVDELNCRPTSISKFTSLKSLTTPFLHACVILASVAFAYCASYWTSMYGLSKWRKGSRVYSLHECWAP